MFQAMVLNVSIYGGVSQMQLEDNALELTNHTLQLKRKFKLSLEWM